MSEITPERGKLIVLEGPDGTGKTTLSQAIATALREQGVKSMWLAFPGREVGTLGKMVYDVHHRAEPLALAEIHPASLQLLHIAAHVDAVERVILPALRGGTWVVLDRFWWSTWVYGIASGADAKSLRRMIELEQVHWGEVKPDAVILLETRRSFDNSVDGAWDRLVAEYSLLAADESKHYQVTRIRNDKSIADAKHAVLAAVSAVNQKQTSIRRVKHVDGFVLPRKPVRAPDGWVKSAPLRPTTVFDTYWRFAAERQAIFFRRINGDCPPWTNDPILNEYKFTNAYRASDRVSQYLIRHVIYEGDNSPDEVFFRTLLFKLFNRIDTWELLRRELGSIRYSDFSFEKYDTVLNDAISRGERIYSAAYIMPSGGARSTAEGGRKHRMHLRLLNTMLREEVPARLAEAASMGRAFDVLRSYPTIGDFLAYQYVTDLNYSTLTNFSEMQFVIPGPGARDGLRKCFADLGGLSEAEVIRYVAERQDAEFERLGLRFQSLWGRKLQLIDCQNLFCEVDKYARVKHPEIAGLTGRTRIKQRYRNPKPPIDYRYPPKWALNEVAAKETSHVSQLLWADGR